MPFNYSYSQYLRGKERRDRAEKEMTKGPKHEY